MTKKQIDELTGRVDALENRLNDVETKINKPKQHYGKLHTQRTKYHDPDTPPEKPPLQPLTPEETEFLAARGFSPEQRTINMQVQMKAVTPQERELIKSIRTKRGLFVTYYS
jgi:hypothetical protein